MTLVKYCNSHHNPLEGCLTLQIGTAEYYRKMDASRSIADKEEGYINYISNPAANGDGGIIGAVITGNTGQNPYIFSISTLEMSPEIELSQFGQSYNSRYYINDSKAFSLIIATELAKQACAADLAKNSADFVNNLSYTPDIKVFTHEGIITYQNTYIMSPEENISLGSFDWFIKSHFRKREGYKDDVEFRFVFVVIETISNTILSFAEGPKLLTFPKGYDWSCLSKEKPQS